MTRFQASAIGVGRRYSGPLDCVRTMAREEGVAVFFKVCQAPLACSWVFH